MEYKSIIYDSGKIPNKITTKGNVLEVNIGEVSGSNIKKLILSLNVKDLPTNVLQKDITIKEL